MRRLKGYTFILIFSLISLLAMNIEISECGAINIAVSESVSEFIMEDNSDTRGKQDEESQGHLINISEHLEVTTFEDKGYINVKINESFIELKEKQSDEIILVLRAGIRNQEDEFSKPKAIIIKPEMVGIDLKISVPEDINIDTENEFSILKIELGIHDTEKDTEKILVSSIIYAPSTKEFEDSRYLSSTEFIKFDDNYLSTRMAKLIRDDSVSDEQFIMRVFMLVSDIEYNNEFIEQGLNSPFYIPNADKTLVTNKGICSDQAVLLAVMLRSQGIPTRYISGYLHLEGHAWNEILINGEWIPVDATSGRFSIDSNYIPRIRY